MRQGAQGWCTGMTLEGWDAEGGQRRVQDGEHMYTHGSFIAMYSKTHYMFKCPSPKSSHPLPPVQVRCTILDAWGWCTGTTQRDGMGREMGEGFRMGNTCSPVADLCQCMAKPLQYCKVISLQLKQVNKCILK